MPSFVDLACSLLPKTKPPTAAQVTAGVTGPQPNGSYPKDLTPCPHCGWEKIAPTFCPVEMSDTPCWWLEKQDVGPKGEVCLWPMQTPTFEIDMYRLSTRSLHSAIHFPDFYMTLQAVWCPTEGTTRKDLLESIRKQGPV